MKTPLPILGVALLLLAAPALPGDGTEKAPAAPERPLPAEPTHSAAITPAEFLWQAAWLSDDARAGRDTGSEGCRAAADWIAARMKAMGLEAPAWAPGYRWSWDFEAQAVKEHCLLEVAREGGKARAFALGTDWNHIMGPAVESIEGPVVFAGYGIKAPKLEYDDYAGVEVTGKIVLALRHEPREKDASSRWNGDRATIWSSFYAKALAAQAAGAAALVVVNDPLNHETDKLDSGGGGVGPVKIPVLFASRAFAEEVLAGTGADLAARQKAIDEKDAPASTKTAATVRMKVVTRMTKSECICGVVPGSDPKLRDEVIVVGAHYDHVGIGQSGTLDARAAGQIHNGADDNASGTACMLEVAEAIGLAKERPRRTVLFLAFSGEERGLLGSAAWVKAAPVPLDRIVAMINLDMVGRYRPGMLDVVAAESGTTLKATVDAAAEGLGLQYRHTNEGITDSDGYCFFRAKVPTLFFFTGLHDEYHRPPDDWWLLNAEGGAKIASWTERTVRRLDADDARPAYVAVQPRPLNRGNRVVLGVTTSDAPGGKGAVVDTVSGNSPAQRAGMKAGDRIVAVGEREVKDAAGLRAALAFSKAGDTVALKVVRGEKTETLSVTFGAGRRGAVFGVSFDAEGDGKKGALVQDVAGGSVAEAAGVKAGDRILAFGGKEVADGAALPELLRGANAGDKVIVKVLRDGKELELEASYPPAK